VELTKNPTNQGKGKPVSFTPGPWQTKPESPYVPAQVWADGRQLAEVYGEDRATRKANARLMAAAPDLLEQLEALVVQIEWAGLIVPDGVYAVISKVKGGAR